MKLKIMANKVDKIIDAYKLKDRSNMMNALQEEVLEPIKSIRQDLEELTKFYKNSDDFQYVSDIIADDVKTIEASSEPHKYLDSFLVELTFCEHLTKKHFEETASYNDMVLNHLINIDNIEQDLKEIQKKAIEHQNELEDILFVAAEVYVQNLDQLKQALQKYCKELELYCDSDRRSLSQIQRMTSSAHIAKKQAGM
jgi:hypothetical protein